MKNLAILIFLLLSFLPIAAQKVFIYNETGNKEYLIEDGSYIELGFENNLDSKSVEELVATISDSCSIIDERYIILTEKTKQSLDIINKIEGVKYANPSLIHSDGTIQIPTDNIFLKVKEGLIIQDVLKRTGIEYLNLMNIGSDESTFLVELTDGNSIKVANYLFETGFFVYSQPSFARLYNPMNALYDNQWGLNNTGQYYGTPGIDINAPEAWQVTTGNSNVKIAVLDNGVDLDHPDLSSNLVVGWDCTDGLDGVEDGDCSNSDPHGTELAGIIAAVDNSIGIKGVSPDCGIVPIRMYRGGTFNHDPWTVNAIQHAWQTAEADVINCSWGGGGSISAVNSEISAALTQGRDGLGCVVVFATGNNNVSISWPANVNPDILSVGAVNQYGERKSPISSDGENWYRNWPFNDYLGGSNYGSELDIMAPGLFISTTDIQGRYGDNESWFDVGDYFSYFGGTSAAAAFVSGVSALVISTNPLLTSQEVRDIIESTTQKVRTDLYTYSTFSGRDNGTWNEQMGYGLLDAFAAVSAARMTLSGISLLCSTGADYSISNVPPGSTINWDPGMGVERVDADGTNPCTFRATSNGRYSTIGATVTRNGKTVTIPAKTVWIGGPPTPTIIPSSNVTTVMSGYYYTVPRNTYNVFFQMGTHPYVNSSLDDWSYSGVNNMYDYGQFLDMTTYNLGENEVIASQYNSCSTGASNAYFVVEVVDSRSGSGGEELSFTLSPNPVKEYVDIKIEFPSEQAKLDKLETYQVDFLDAYSRNVKRVKLSGASNRVNIQELPKGYYVVMLRYDGDVSSNKLIVE